jgi:hypothetical protein
MNNNIIEGINGEWFVEDVKPGGFKKVEDYATKSCLHPSHNPPGYIVLKPGLYEYTCPSCGKITMVSSPLITC